MIEELKVIAEIFSKTTDSALYAYLAFITYKLSYVALIVFPVVSTIKFMIDRIFKDETTDGK